MSQSVSPDIASRKTDKALSLYHLLDPEVLANPYPLYHRLRDEDPVHWDPFLHAWVVTRYADVIHVLHHFSANRTPTPEQLSAMGLSALNPIAQVMVRQMLFWILPITLACVHSLRPRSPCEELNACVRISRKLWTAFWMAVISKGSMDLIADFASPAPAIVTAELLGVPVADHAQLKDWSADFAEMLGNFQHNPDRFPECCAVSTR